MTFDDFTTKTDNGERGTRASVPDGGERAVSVARVEFSALAGSSLLNTDECVVAVYRRFLPPIEVFSRHQARVILQRLTASDSTGYCTTVAY